MKGGKEVAWKQRIGNYEESLFDRLGEQRLWITIQDFIDQTVMDTTEMDSTDSVSDTIPVSLLKTFKSLTPGKKFQIAKDLAKPQNTQYHKDGTLSIQVTEREANELIGVRTVGSVKISITKNRFKNRVRGVIKNDVIKSSPKEEIIEDLEEYGATGAYIIEKPLRDSNDKIIRKDQKIQFGATGSAVITFEKEQLPPYVILFGLRLEVTQYIPDAMQCRKCYNYGHTKKWCKEAVPICGWCSIKSHTEDGQKCENKPKCRHCDEGHDNHANFDKQCPMYVREKNLAEIREINKVPQWKAVEILDGKAAAGKNTKCSWAETINRAEACNSPPNSSIDDRLNKLLAESATEGQRVNKLTAVVETWGNRLTQIENTLQTLMETITNSLLNKSSEISPHHGIDNTNTNLLDTIPHQSGQNLSSLLQSLAGQKSAFSTPTRSYKDQMMNSDARPPKRETTQLDQQINKKTKVKSVEAPDRGPPPDPGDVSKQ